MTSLLSGPGGQGRKGQAECHDWYVRDLSDSAVFRPESSTHEVVSAALRTKLVTGRRFRRSAWSYSFRRSVEAARVRRPNNRRRESRKEPCPIEAWASIKTSRQP